MFQPYDHVLVRDAEGEEWFATFYSHTRETKYGVFHVICSGEEFLQCIPYHSSLVGTTEDGSVTHWDEV